MVAPVSTGREGAGNVFALPLRAPNSAREHVLVSNGLSRAVGTLPGADLAAADARLDAQGRWPVSLSGIEVRVAGQIATILAVRRTAVDTYSVDFVVPVQVTPTASGSRIPIVVRHTLSGAQWRLSAVELLENAPVIWGRQDDGQTFPSALALESPTLIAFDQSNRVPTNGEMRVMLFVSGLGIGRAASNTRLLAQFSDGTRIPLPVEHIGTTNFPGIDQITFKADQILSGQMRVLLSIEGGEEVWLALHLR